MTIVETGRDDAALPALEHPLEDGWALPAQWYTDQHVYELERERIFARAWMYIGPAEHVREPGSFLTGRVGHVPVVAARGRDGELRAFLNVCRHRNHLVAEGNGCRATLQCPYHAWTYDLDGSLLKAPRSEREPGFDPAGFSLFPASVASWGPWVFANPDPEAPPLAELLDGARELVESSGVDLNTLRFRRRIEWEAPVNWKNALENYLECYHCPVAHPGLSKVVDVDPDAYRLLTRPLSTSQLGELRASVRDGSVEAPFNAIGEVGAAQYHHLWPATTINIEPGIPNVGFDTWVPTGPRGTSGFSDYYFGSDVSDEDAAELIAFSQQVGAEDTGLVLNVQAGLDSGVVPQGRLLLPSELLIAHFQRRVYEALTS